MPAPATHLYVYYRLAADTPAARATVAAVLADVATTTRVAGRLLAGRDDALTWMEIYEPVADAAAFAKALAEIELRHGAAAVAVDGRRHAEWFIPIHPASPVASGAPTAG